jgi:hypothetical protein
MINKKYEYFQIAKALLLLLVALVLGILGIFSLTHQYMTRGILQLLASLLLSIVGFVFSTLNHKRLSR